MVKKLSPQVQETITKAISEAKRRTSAEIIVTALPASDAYQSHLVSYGLIFGSLIGMGLWMEKIITAFPLLFGIQVAGILLVLFLPPLRCLFMTMISKRVLHHHAARRAFEEFLFVSRHVPAEKPVVLLYISLTERYVHILHSRAVTQKIPPETWQAIVQEFTAHMKNAAQQEACVTAVRSIALALERPFPA